MRYPTVAHEWFNEVWNKRNDDAIAQLLASDAIGHGLEGPDREEPCGPDGFRPYHRMILEAFPDLQLKVDDCILDGSRYAVRCSVSATHLGEFEGVEPTGRAVQFTGVCYLRIEEGMIREAWNYFDFDGLREQIRPQISHPAASA